MPSITRTVFIDLERARTTTNLEQFTILGAWDGDPDRGIISYQTAIGQALLGHKLGEVVTLTDDDLTRRFAIISIEPAPVDVTPPDPSPVEVEAEAVAAE